MNVIEASVERIGDGDDIPPEMKGRLKARLEVTLPEARHHVEFVSGEDGVFVPGLVAIALRLLAEFIEWEQMKEVKP